MNRTVNRAVQWRTHVGGAVFLTFPQLNRSAMMTTVPLSLSLLALTAPPIVLDGTFDDWSSIDPIVEHAAGAPVTSQVDFRSVRITHDYEYVYLHVDFGHVVNLQALDGRVAIVLDVDGDAETGEQVHGVDGVDVIIELSPASDRFPDRPGRGVGLRSTTYEHDPDDETSQRLSPYDISFAMAPTYASRDFEFRIERGVNLPDTPTLLRGDSFRGQLVFTNVGGSVLDATDVFAYELTDVSPRQLRQEYDPLARSDATDFRIVSWNAEHGSLVPNPGPFARVLSALQPDIVLWQELTDKNSASQISAWMNEHVASDELNTEARWHVVFAEGGGPLRTAVASRHQIDSVKALAVLPYRDRPDRQVRVAGAAVTISGKRLLVVSVHLKCCGAMDTREDRQRMTEVRMINNAVRNAIADGDFDGVIFGGDLNLVGERIPKIMLAHGLDYGDSLVAVNAMQLSRASNATWSEPRSPFTPGRLDWLLYSASSMTVDRGFVLDVTDLTPKWLDRHNLLFSDTLSASDHFPVVADLVWATE